MSQTTWSRVRYAPERGPERDDASRTTERGGVERLHNDPSRVLAGNRRTARSRVRPGQKPFAGHQEGFGSVDPVTTGAVCGVRPGVVEVEVAVRAGSPDALFDALERGRAAFAGKSAGVRAPVAATARDVRADLALTSGTVVANYAVVGGDVVVVRVDEAGAHLIRLAGVGEIGERIRRVQADLRIVANDLIPAAIGAVAKSSLARGLDALDRLLVVPLRVEAGLHVVARAPLLDVPWSALPSRRGLPTWANAWTDRCGSRGSGKGVKAVCVAGPGARSAGSEAWAVAGVWPRATVLVDGAATCAAAIGAFDEASVVHVAAHGRHDAENPLFSSIRLADGPLFAHELDTIDVSGVVVVLSACELGLASVCVGGEILGLTSVLLRRGATAVVASVAPLRDDVAAHVMPTLHACLRDGTTPGEALARAVIDEHEPVPLVCFGPFGS